MNKNKKIKVYRGKGLLGDIFNKGKDILVDKSIGFVKDNKLISKGLAAASLNPTFAPITAPLSLAASFFGYGKKNKKMKMKKLKLMM